MAHLAPVNKENVLPWRPSLPRAGYKTYTSVTPCYSAC